MFYNHCVADTVNGYAIDPRGDLFKCWNEVGRRELAFGNVWAEGGGMISNEGNFYKYVLDNPFNSSCKSCGFVPVCMGGCPLERHSGSRVCAKYKFQSDEFVGLYLDSQGLLR